MPDETAKLKLGKGVAFVKTRLRALPLNDDIWEADFGILDDGVIWLGLVVCPTSGAIFASEICDHSPDVNDLANLLAHAMRRPSIGNSRRPARIRLHDNSMWDEVKRQAAGRWPEILRTVCGLDDRQLNPRVHGPCPQCGGRADRATEAGTVRARMVCSESQGRRSVCSPDVAGGAKQRIVGQRTEDGAWTQGG